MHRRARMRRNYFKLVGEEPRKRVTDLDSASGSESDSSPRKPEKDNKKRSTNKKTTNEEKVEPEKKLTGKQLARHNRSLKHHQMLDKQRELENKKRMRKSHSRAMTKTTAKGQPKLGSQMGVLLDKIKKDMK